MTMHTEQRTVLVPEGLSGERVDAAMARMFGFSRTKAADLIARGLVEVDGASVGKSDRIHGGSMLDVTIPAERDPLAGTVDAPIGRHPKHDYKFAVMADGRHSVTHYETLEAHRFASLLEIHLETGRTHQIRVHMSALKHPCVGDLTYGADPTLAKRVGLERQWLHAMRLGFEHPETGDYVTYESTYPDDLAHALDVIRDEH